MIIDFTRKVIVFCPSLKSMPSIYDKKIMIVVQSKYPQILEEFKKTFEPTTQDFKNLKLEVLAYPQEYGAPAINKILIPAIKNGYEYFGVFNDDLWFAMGWLEDTLSLLMRAVCASPGYVETEDFEKFELAVEKTGGVVWVARHLYGPTAIFRTDIFKKIGIFDERYEWSIDDLDWAWRIKINGFLSLTSKKITTAHRVGTTRTKNIKAWNILSERNKQRFYDKHGYVAYREIRREYKEHHQYFRQFR